MKQRGSFKGAVLLFTFYLTDDMVTLFHCVTAQAAVLPQEDSVREEEEAGGQHVVETKTNRGRCGAVALVASSGFMSGHTALS